jgi:hypothetical protein
VHQLVVTYGHFLHTAGDVGADCHPRGLHIGVVGRFKASPAKIEISGDGEHRDRPEQHQRQTEALAWVFCRQCLRRAGARNVLLVLIRFIHIRHSV